MDRLEYLSVRFHFGGEFINNWRETFYVGGSEGMSYIERDKISLPELIGYLKDHCEVLPGMLLHWLFPGKELADGLRVLVDDKVCDYMSKCVVDGGVAEIYVEAVVGGESNESGSSDDSDFEDELEDMSLADDEWDDLNDDAVFELPTGKPILLFSQHQRRQKINDGALVQIQGEEDNSPYENSSADGDSYEEDSDGQLVRKKSKYPIFNANQPHVRLALGMKFDGKKEFKEAVVQLALQNKRFIRFPKDEGYRTRAKCDWATCPWSFLLSRNSRTNSWQIASLVDEHNCPPRKDNNLVTYKRIAQKYEKTIIDNPTWSIQSMQSTVSEQMFANETNDSWDWFCDLLCKDLGFGEGDGWVFISDQQKGIVNAVQHWAPSAEHRNCARHIYANWKKKFSKKEWQKKFWRCAKAPNVMLFNLAKARLAQETVEGARAIMNTDPSHWSRAWFRFGSNYDSVDNNICETFNKWIVQARFLPIISMLEAIRRKVMVRIHEKITLMDKWLGSICPNIHKKLNAYIIDSGNCHAICNGMDKFEVKHQNHRFTVDLERKTCSCRIYSFKKTYSCCLEPVEGMESWPTSDRPRPKAPGYVRMPGRPSKKEMRRELHEKPKATRVSRVGSVMTCRLCKLLGHNKASCHKRRQQQQGNVQAQGSQPSSTQDQAHVAAKHMANASSSRKRQLKASTSARAAGMVGVEQPRKKLEVRRSPRLNRG
ncbi:hypothetical protein OsJ_18027 [Oryza sativa Japonica Group]|uniref:Uncharacterized protein n=1 Tax=Oryza sativa subsp. japonica TaxID=39947 RepID=B9FKG3_ORYSJ|nr:hypothetical protein OsJ_18027 [Oryza sativa Japonica Group]